jgi:hypothetical protein
MKENRTKVIQIVGFGHPLDRTAQPREVSFPVVIPDKEGVDDMTDLFNIDHVMDDLIVGMRWSWFNIAARQYRMSATRAADLRDYGHVRIDGWTFGIKAGKSEYGDKEDWVSFDLAKVMPDEHGHACCGPVIWPDNASVEFAGMSCKLDKYGDGHIQGIRPKEGDIITVAFNGRTVNVIFHIAERWKYGQCANCKHRACYPPGRADRERTLFYCDENAGSAQASLPEWQTEKPCRYREPRWEEGGLE